MTKWSWAIFEYDPTPIMVGGMFVATFALTTLLMLGLWWIWRMR